MKYTTSFTKEQLVVLARGLEFYSRFLAGQWLIPFSMENKEFKNQNKPLNFWSVRNEVNDEFLKLNSKFTNLELNESYGISSSELSEDAKISYDIYRPILEEFSKGETWSVYSYPSLSFSKEGRIKIEAKDE